MRLGIRREDKNEWERRTPLTPELVGRLIEEHNLSIILQPSPLRIFPDEEYGKAGAVISEDLSSCPVILAVKEIPIEFFEPGKTYVFFSHTIKGQDYNMPMLKRMMDLKCTLIDYEIVTDDEGRRLIFFGRHAGLAGMIDSLWTLSRRVEHEGSDNPFAEINRAFEYRSLAEAKHHISIIGKFIAENGLPEAITPFVCGITGYGNVSLGAQEILDLLPVKEITPAELLHYFPTLKRRDVIYKVVFKEEDTVVPLNKYDEFDLQDYYDHPEKYRSRFEDYLPYLTMLVNCIYWTSDYPRLVTKKWVKGAYAGSANPRLKVIGDISIDIEGSVECSVKATDPGNPCYVYDPVNDVASDGVEGRGPVIMAVDNLPCELSAESSTSFSEALSPLIPALVEADYGSGFESLNLPNELKRAVILLRGDFTPDYKQLIKYL